MKPIHRSLFFLLIGIYLASCNHAARSVPGDKKPVETYFSSRQFVQDQWQTYYGQPFSLYRISKLNGVVDSTLVNFLDMDWGTILKIFLATDIGDPKYLGQYNFSVFDDNTSGNRTAMYEAKDPDLFTRLLQITVDPSSNRILSLYVQTAKNTSARSTQQRLLYIPLKIIQIQEDEHTIPGIKRNLIVEYRFLQ